MTKEETGLEIEPGPVSTVSLGREKAGVGNGQGAAHNEVRLSLGDLLQRREALDPELAGCLRTNESGLEGVPVLKHPLVYAVPYTTVENAFLNAYLRQQRGRVERAIGKRQMSLYVSLHERPYRCDAIVSWLKRVPQKEREARRYWETVAWAWCDSENVLENEAAWKRLWTRPPEVFKATRHLAMSRRDREALARMGDEIEVWHGEELEGRGPGWSWTTDEKIALWFARRYGGHRRVYRGSAPKGKVMAYMSGRGESEVLIMPRHVRGVEVVRWG